jgi:hypothetical protein
VLPFGEDYMVIKGRPVLMRAARLNAEAKNVMLNKEAAKEDRRQEKDVEKVAAALNVTSFGAGSSTPIQPKNIRKR